MQKCGQGESGEENWGEMEEINRAQAFGLRRQAGMPAPFYYFNMLSTSFSTLFRHFASSSSPSASIFLSSINH